MFCNSTSAHRTGRYSLPALAALLLFSPACGHKAPPFPPPLRHPATTKDLVVQQRGEEVILTFGYPQTTVSGTVLEPLQVVEYWELERAVPQWTPPDLATGPATAEGAEESIETDLAADEALAPEPVVGVFEGIAGSGDDQFLADDVKGEKTPTAEAGRDEKTETDGETDGEADEAESDELDEGTEDTEPAPPPEPPTKEKLLTVDGREFTATASLTTSLDGGSLTAATFGDQIVMTLPMGVPPRKGVGKEKKDERKEPETADAEEGAEDVEELELEYGKVFAIKTGVSQKLISTFSNVVALAYRTAPEPPDTFSIEPGPGRITVRWPADDDEVLGFHVYRREAESPAYGPPLTFVPLEDPLKALATDSEEEEAEEEEIEEPREREHTDHTALYGQRYIYALTAVSNREPVVESAIIIEREVDYADRFAPSTPQGLIALAEAGRVRLLWNASPQDDVVGYSLLRSERGGDFEPLSDEPIVELEYSDREIRSGQPYRYKVVAVDDVGNESPPSSIVEVRAP